MGAFFRRLIALFQRSRLERDLDDELAFHLAMRKAKEGKEELASVHSGRAAGRQFGNVLRVKEQSQDAWVFAWLESVLQDLRFALRELRRNPGFTAIAVLTLAVGIGATTALVSVADAILIRPLPYPASDRIVQIGGNGRPAASIRYGGPRLFELSHPELKQNPAVDLRANPSPVYSACGRRSSLARA